jgi:hypothetical protein
MDEGERDQLAVVASERVDGDGIAISWETLWANTIGSVWGRTTAPVEIVGIDPWVLRAELSR